MKSYECALFLVLLLSGLMAKGRVDRELTLDVIEGAPDSPQACKNAISPTLCLWGNGLEYQVAYDCDDFANAFLNLCKNPENEPLGITCAFVGIFCETHPKQRIAGHAVNLACYHGTCCGVEPQRTPGKPCPTIIPGTCFPEPELTFPASDTRKYLSPSLCNQFCRGTNTGTVGAYCFVSESSVIDPHDFPSVQCSTNRNKNNPPDFQGCCSCCWDVLSNFPRRSWGNWGLSCEQSCQSQFKTQEWCPVPRQR